MVAVVAAFNEVDVIGPVIADLVAQGVGVYFIDDGSTDGTLERARAAAGSGWRGEERRQGGERFAWEAILRRKEELAASLDADWVIHADADELRESPWEGVALPEAFSRVERLGYNAVDFQVYNFVPTDDGFVDGGDLRVAFPYCERGAVFDRLQIKAWRARGRVELASSGGHEARFDGRRVFPVRFVLRHYPVRTEAQGRRKVFAERTPRFLDEERARGWHVQYDAVAPGHRFVRPPEGLWRFDGEAVRFELCQRNREVEAAEALAAGLHGELAAVAAELEAVQATVVAAQQQATEAQVAIAATRADATRRAAAAEADLRLGRERVADLERQLLATEADRVQLDAELARVGRQLDDLYASKSWRWSAPLRALLAKKSR